MILGNGPGFRCAAAGLRLLMCHTGMFLAAIQRLWLIEEKTLDVSLRWHDRLCQKAASEREMTFKKYRKYL